MAKNRNSRTGQDKSSIKDFTEKQISQMIVKIAKRVYFGVPKFLSGSVVSTNQGVKVVQGTGDSGNAIKFVGDQKNSRTNKFDVKLILAPSGMVSV